MGKQRLFISYCWKDGNTYADELETQLKDTFDVKRDKSQLIANDNLYDFMAEIANFNSPFMFFCLPFTIISRKNMYRQVKYLLFLRPYGKMYLL